MELSTIIERQSAFSLNSGVHVNIDRAFSWVNITDQKGGEVFLQSRDADQFIERIDNLSDELPDLDFETIRYAVAYDYLDLLD